MFLTWLFIQCACFRPYKYSDCLGDQRPTSVGGRRVFETRRLLAVLRHLPFDKYCNAMSLSN